MDNLVGFEVFIRLSPTKIGIFEHNPPVCRLVLLLDRNAINLAAISGKEKACTRRNYGRNRKRLYGGAERDLSFKMEGAQYMIFSNSAVLLMHKVVILSLLLSFSLNQLFAEDFSTVNGDKLAHFFDAFEKRNGPVRVVSFGDSMAAAYDSIAIFLMNRFLTNRPFAGTSFNNSYNTSIWSSTNGATALPASGWWFSYLFKIPRGSSIWWENYLNVQGVLSDQLGLYWVAQPEGGPFDLMVSDKGGEWVKKLSLDGYSPTVVGRCTNITVSLIEHRMAVQSSAGTNYIIGPELVNTRTNGIHMGWLDYSGLTYYDILAVPLAIREPILKGFAPDLLIWHLKEEIPILPLGLDENESWFKKSAPEMDVLYIGTPWYAFDLGGALTIEQNRIVRAWALEHNRGYLDCMTSSPNYEWLRDNGYMRDFIHQTTQGSTYVAQYAWYDIGFFALGADRRLEIMKSNEVLTLNCNFRSGLVYEFQSSSNLIDWTTFFRTNGNGDLGRIQVPTESLATEYRVKLLPPE
jgi:hypothetical protein